MPVPPRIIDLPQGRILALDRPHAVIELDCAVGKNSADLYENGIARACARQAALLLLLD